MWGSRSTYPEIVGELQGKDGDALVVKGASNRAGNIAGNDGDEAGRQQPRALVPQLPGQQEGGDGRQTAEHRRQKHTHIPDVDRDVQKIQDVVDQAGRDHQPWIHLNKGARRQTAGVRSSGSWEKNSFSCLLTSSYKPGTRDNDHKIIKTVTETQP